MTNDLAEKPMSYEEMIDTLKGLVFGTFDRTTPKEREALGRAIDLLSNSDEDCISRALAQEEITKSIELKENPHQLWKRIQGLPSVINRKQEEINQDLWAENEELQAEIEKYKKAIEDIKAEITDESRFCPYTEGLEKALEIIDKHLEKEQE